MAEQTANSLDSFVIRDGVLEQYTDYTQKEVRIPDGVKIIGEKAFGIAGVGKEQRKHTEIRRVIAPNAFAFAKIKHLRFEYQPEILPQQFGEMHHLEDSL